MKTLMFLIISNLLCLQDNSAQIENNTLKADTLFKTFKYDSASVYYRKAAQFFEKQQDWLNCVKNYRSTSNSLLKAAKYDTAFYYSKRAFYLAEKHFEETNKIEMFEKSDILLNIADVNEKKGKFEVELACCRNALELILKTDSSAKLKIANSWNKIGEAYTSLGKYDSALIFCKRANEVRTQILGDNHIDVAESNFDMGFIYKTYGKYNKSLDYYTKALKIRLLILGEKNPLVAENYMEIGTVHERNWELDTAAKYLEKSLLITKSVLGENHPNVASCYNNLAIVCGKGGRYEKSEEYSLKSLRIYISNYGENQIKTAYIYNNLGITNRKMGKIDKALEYYQESLRISIAFLGDKHPDIAGLYNNIGILYMLKEEYEEALENLKKSLNIQITKYGENNEYVARNYVNIGNTYTLKGEYDKAQEYIRRSLKIRIMTMGESNPQVSDCYRRLCEIMVKTGKLDEALDYGLRSLTIDTLNNNQKDPIVADVYESIGDVFTSKGNYKMALRYYQKGLIANSNDFNDTILYSNPIDLKNVFSKPTELELLAKKAFSLYQLYSFDSYSITDIEASLITYCRAFQLVNEMRNDYVNETTRLLLSRNTKNYYLEAERACLEYKRVNKKIVTDSLAFDFIEKSKSATMFAMFNEYKAQHFGYIPDSLLRNENELRTKIGFYTTRVENMKYQKNGYDTLKVNAFENENFTCSRNLDSLIAYFEIAYPAYYELKYANKTVSIPELQKSLDNNTAILNYFVGDSGLFIAIITDSLYKMEEISIDSSFKKQITSYYRDIKIAETNLFVANSQHIYEKLIKPVERYITQKKHLIVIPDDYLYYLPFETLIDHCFKSKNENNDYSQLNYLIKSHSISYHHSATLWYNFRKREAEQTAKQKINFIGFAPVFSKEKNNGLILSSNINVLDSTGHNLVYRSISSDFKSFNPLPNSKDEVTSIVHLFEKRNKEAKAYLYSEASETNFKNNAGNYSIIHVSSHGFSNDKEPDLSGIVFSQPLEGLEKEDGILYTGETYNLNLNADLVVLSSCESGMGKLIKGEGLQALSRGFLYAGTPNIMFSLWKVLDRPTKDLMVQFYSHVLDGQSYAESLREAKLKLINNTKTAFPHFWSGFVLVGK